MTADVSKPKHAWPFMSAGTGATEPERIRAGVFEILKREGRAMHTGELAALVKATTSEVHTAMHHPHQTGKVHFTSSGGWDLAPTFTPIESPDARQSTL